MARHRDVLILGAGPCGLAIARQLKHKFGNSALVLERSYAPAASWRARYEGFRLNTSGYWSHLPGQRISARHGRWPSKDAMVQYFDSYVTRQGVDIALGTDVTRLDRAHQGGWLVETSQGSYTADAVVVALGNYRVAIPARWPGVEEFPGKIVHSADYRNPWPFQDEDVLVVGSGNSAADIAVQLSQGVARNVRLAVRTPPHLVKRSTLGIPADAFSLLVNRAPASFIDSAAGVLRSLTFGDLAKHGFDKPPAGIYTTVRDTGRIPTLADVLIKEIRAGRIEVVPAVQAVEGNKVRLADGSLVNADSIVNATGFTHGLDSLVGHLGVLDANGHPSSNGPTPAEPGLWFAGYAEPFTGPLRSFRKQATPIARQIHGHLAGKQAAPTDGVHVAE